jgi:predicted Zn-dependent protease with MMP-like domain
LLLLATLRQQSREPSGEGERATLERWCRSRDRFEQLVASALDSIRSELGNKMSNVAVMVEERGDTDNILGLGVLI